MQVTKVGGFLIVNLWSQACVRFCLPGTIWLLGPALTLSPTQTHRTAPSGQEKLGFCFCLGVCFNDGVVAF